MKPLINDSTIKFYAICENGTLFVIKQEDICNIQGFLNNSNLRFTVDLFQNDVPHFLHLELSLDGVLIFRKNKNTGLYTFFLLVMSHGLFELHRLRV